MVSLLFEVGCFSKDTPELSLLGGQFTEKSLHQRVWSYLKVAYLANLVCDNLSELDAHLHMAKMRIQHKHYLIRAFIQDAGYEV